MDERKYSLISHVSDLKNSIFRSILGVLLGTVISFLYADRLLLYLYRPILGATRNKALLFTLSPQEYFLIEMKIAVLSGCLLTMPWMYYQIWRFISPGLYRNEKNCFILLSVFSIFFFMTGILFSYFLILPNVYNFFSMSLPFYINKQYSIGSIFQFSTSLLISFGFIFETPLLVFLLVKANVLKLKSLQASRRYFVVFSFILAAILTPTPDMVTQTMMAIPVIVLFEVGILACKLFNKDNV